MELTHASFFSGVGGLDLGLERAGWRTVSFSEIDPYASAVLAERWPGVPNLGDVTALDQYTDAQTDIPDATLWSGGFPCQDLSVAGQRRGFADGTRSSLAFAFLDLVERHRPPALLIENVPGLLSSHGGRDFGTLLSRLAELGYGWAYRILDAQYFGVPQRRRRVFIVAIDASGRAGADSAAEVLSVGSRCDGHSATSDEAGEGAAERTTVGAIPAGVHGFPDGVQEFMQGHFRVVSPSPNPGGVREADGLAGRLDDNERVVNPILSNGQGGNRTTDLNIPLAFVKAARVNAAPDSPESWKEGGPMSTLNSFDVGDIRTTAAILGEGPADDPMLPLGLDSHRYRCCGNGVVAPVSEWIGHRLAAVMA